MDLRRNADRANEIRFRPATLADPKERRKVYLWANYIPRASNLTRAWRRLVFGESNPLAFRVVRGAVAAADRGVHVLELHLRRLGHLGGEVLEEELHRLLLLVRVDEIVVVVAGLRVDAA